MSHTNSPTSASGVQPIIMVVVWLWVLVPFAWGVYELILKVKDVFS